MADLWLMIEAEVSLPVSVHQEESRAQESAVLTPDVSDAFSKKAFLYASL